MASNIDLETILTFNEMKQLIKDGKAPAEIDPEYFLTPKEMEEYIKKESGDGKQKG